MAKKKADKMKFVCNKCGKDMPENKEKSTVNWKVYETKCECGGTSTIKFID